MERILPFPVCKSTASAQQDILLSTYCTNELCPYAGHDLYPAGDL
jgi:hypothetical protein